MKITAVNEGGVWVLRTPTGNPVGTRLLRAPQDKEPPLECRYTDELAAKNAALQWNLYLMKKDKAKK